MPDPHPQGLRERAVQSYEDGVESYLVVAQRFSIGVASLQRWVCLKRNEGTLDPRPKGGGTQSTITAADIEALMHELWDRRPAS